MREFLYFTLILFLFVVFFFLSVLHESIYISIFFLISLFLLSSFLFLMSGLEFVGFLYLIVYVGAVAVLFLFMVMLFDRTEYIIFNRELGDKYTFFGKCLSVLFFSFIFTVIFYYVLVSRVEPICDGVNSSFFTFLQKDLTGLLSFSDNYSNIEFIGALLYDYFFIALLGASFVLLLGMIGAIILTQNVSILGQAYRHQEIKEQLIRRTRK